MRATVLFIHGAGEGAYKEDKKLAESLTRLLSDSCKIRYPEMQNEVDAPYEVWAQQIRGELASSTGDVILVGHSVGGSVLIKFLAEEKTNIPIAGIFLIAAPFWGGDGGWTYDGYETLMLPSQSETKLPAHVPLFLYHSEDDQTVPFAHVMLYGKRFPGATVRKFKARGHQMNDDLSEVVNDIKKMLTSTSI
jgi:uncharacterized protein